MLLIILKQLYRNLTISSFPRCALQIALKCYAAQRPLFRKISRSYRYDQRTVCIAAVPGLIAHTIYSKHLRFWRSVYYITARTHTKGINTTAIFTCVGNFISSSSKFLVFLFPIKSQIDHGLWMFHTYTYCKRFWFHIDSFFLKHEKGISCAMSNCQHTYLGRNPFFPIYLNFF